MNLDGLEINSPQHQLDLELGKFTLWWLCSILKQLASSSSQHVSYIATLYT